MKPIDEFGLPGCRQNDGSVEGGDAAAIWGTVVALLDDEFTRTLIEKQNHFLKRGQPVRHPTTTEWFGEIKRFTRDQMVPVLCAGLLKPNDIFLDAAIIHAHSKNYFLYAFNRLKNKSGYRYDSVYPDITLFQIWALESRRLNTFKWLRWLFDLENFFGAVFMPFTKSRVTRNHMLIALTCYLVEPTFVSRYTFLFTNWVDVIERWKAHCDAVGEYQTGDLFEAKISEIFRQRSQKIR